MQKKNENDFQLKVKRFFTIIKYFIFLFFSRVLTAGSARVQRLVARATLQCLYTIARPMMLRISLLNKPKRKGKSEREMNFLTS